MMFKGPWFVDFLTDILDWCLLLEKCQSNIEWGPIVDQTQRNIYLSRYFNNMMIHDDVRKQFRLHGDDSLDTKP